MELWRVIYLPKMCGWNFIFSTLNINLVLCRNTDNKTKQEELRLKRISLLQQMGEKYFKTESDKCLALANQVNGVAMVWMVDVDIFKYLTLNRYLTVISTVPSQLLETRNC